MSVPSHAQKEKLQYFPIIHVLIVQHGFDECVMFAVMHIERVLGIGHSVSLQ